MIKALLNRYFYQILILFTVVLGYFMISFFIHPLKWDYTAVAYPFHFFIGECLQNGELPLWNPYQFLGYPIHADPQSASWYPVVWFFGYFFGYNIYILNIEFLFHVFIAALGFYSLCKRFKLLSKTAFAAAIVYAFSGFIVTNSSHFYLIYSAAWIPWIISYYIKLKNQPKLINSIIFALFIYLGISGGYPGFSIMLIYLFILIIGVDTIVFMRDDIKNKTGLKKSRAILLVFYLFLSAVFSILLLLPFLVSWIQIYPDISRAGGIEIGKVLKDPLTYESFISLIFPYTTALKTDFFRTSLLMTNMYIGIFPLMLAGLGIIIKKPKEVVIIGLFGLFSLFFALGDSTPIREFCYNYLPFTSIMRMPGLYRYYTVFAMVFLFAFALDYYLKSDNKKVKNISIVLLGLFSVVLVGIIIYLKSTIDLHLSEFIKQGFFVKKDNFSLSTYVSFQSIMLLSFVLLTMGLLLLRKKIPKLFPYLFVGIICLEIISSNLLNQASKLYFEEYTVAQVAKCNNSFPKGFPVIDNTVLISNNKDQGNGCEALWRNMGIFRKHISYDGYSSFILSSYEKFEQQDDFKQVLENSFVFYVDTSINNNIVISTFGPNSFEIKTNNTNDQELIVMQNYSRFWQATTTNSILDINVKHNTLMSVNAPPNSTICFVYKPTIVIVSFYISAVSLLLILIYLMYNYFFAESRYNKN